PESGARACDGRARLTSRFIDEHVIRGKEDEGEGGRLYKVPRSWFCDQVRPRNLHHLGVTTVDPVPHDRIETALVVHPEEALLTPSTADPGVHDYLRPLLELPLAPRNPFHDSRDVGAGDMRKWNLHVWE